VRPKSRRDEMFVAPGVNGAYAIPYREGYPISK